MKLDEITNNNNKGTYAGVRFSKTTTDAVNDFSKENEIPKPLPADKMHSTLLYSRKYCPKYKAQGNLDTPWIGTPIKFEVWPSQPDDDGNKANCLVLRYKCDELTQRHEELMDEHKATFDFDEFSPHITLSYDVGDLKITNLTVPSLNIEIVSEYQEDLDLNWAENNE